MPGAIPCIRIYINESKSGNIFKKLVTVFVY
jgi:hypothetical protein